MIPTNAARHLAKPVAFVLAPLTAFAAFVGTTMAQDTPAAPTATPVAPTTAVPPAGTATPTPTGGFFGLDTLILPIALLGIFWFLVFRPQQKRMRQQQDMLKAIRRGDTVVTSGGIVGKVTKAVDGEDLEVEIAPNTRIKVVRHMISDVRSKSEPVNDNKPA